MWYLRITLTNGLEVWPVPAGPRCNKLCHSEHSSTRRTEFWFNTHRVRTQAIKNLYLVYLRGIYKFTHILIVIQPAGSMNGRTQRLGFLLLALTVVPFIAGVAAQGSIYSLFECHVYPA